MSHVTVSFRAPVLSAALTVLVAASAATAQWQTGAESSSSSAPSSQGAPATSGDSGTIKSAEPAIAPAPVKKLSPRRERLFREQAASGNSLYTIGSISTWVGLAAYWGGGFGGVPAVSSLGALAMWSGIPMMGVGSGQVQDAALAIDPEAGTAGSAGWALYGLGLVSQIAGSVVIVSNLHDDGGGNGPTAPPAAIITGLSLQVAGQIMHYVSWYQFSRRRALGNINLASWSLQPEVRLAAGGAALPGARLTYRF